MKSLRLASNSEQKTRISKRCNFLLAEAEKIKRDPEWQPSQRPRPPRSQPRFHVRQLEEPISPRQHSTAEKIILLRASKLNGFTFPEWEGPPKPSQFEMRLDRKLFQDSSDLSLSEMQLDIFKGWKRPSEALPPPAWYPVESRRMAPVMDAESETDLVQDAATDCSVVASLCADSARAEGGHSKIILSKLYPQDPKTGAPRFSQNGKYVVKLNFNGCYRKVEIDDRLPVSKTQRMLHVIDRHNPALLWPALIEKAYLKVRGGYDLPGSNSGTDLWILTGWIPQQTFFQSNETTADELWKRIFNAFAYGDVLVTLGTGTMSNSLERQLGLAGQHDYAVLDLQEKDGQRLLLVKNPWCDGTSWKGNIPTLLDQDGSDGGQASESSSEAPLIDLEPEEAETQSSSTLETGLRPGLFWIDLPNVMQHFDSIYLNWNPGLFTHRQDIHFSWNLSTDTSQKGRVDGSLVSNPQFVIASAAATTVWLLLSRHFRGKAELSDSGERSSLRDDRFEEFICLYAFTNGGKRVYLNDGSIQRAPFVDSPHTLLCLELESSTPYSIVVHETGLKSLLHGFTLTAFSRTPITLSDPNSYPHQNAVQGSWNSSTAGGDITSESYARNPQFSLTLSQRTPLTIMVMTSMANVHVHVMLVHSGQKANRVPRLVRKDIIANSGDYRKASALAELSSALEPGTYAMICSTFEAGKPTENLGRCTVRRKNSTLTGRIGQVGDFTLRVDSMEPTSIHKLPQEGAGRLRKSLARASFRQGTMRVAAPIVPKRLTRAGFTAKHKGTFSKPKKTPAKNGGMGFEFVPQEIESHSLLQMTLEIGRGPMRRILIASSNGQHADAVNGIQTEEVDLYPEMLTGGDLWLVLDRMSATYEAVEEWFEVEMLSDTLDGLSIGVWRTWYD